MRERLPAREKESASAARLGEVDEMGPPWSTRAKLRISPPRLISTSPSSSARTVSLPNAAAGIMVTSSPSSAKCPSATPAESGV
jgi:hypothetical protein